jgi:hypothetical protein
MADLPRGSQWASKSAAHRRLQRWQADGTLAAMPARLLGLAEERGMTQWQYGAIDGSFSPWQGRWCRCRPRSEGERDPHPQPHRWGGHAIVRANDTREWR